MAKYRILQANFWDDGFVLDLTPEEKYFYNYLLTNGRASQCGCYELPFKIMEMQTGYNRETVEKLIKRFIEYGKIKYDSTTKEILIINWSKHNFSKSPKVRTCILKEVESIKNKEFQQYMYRVCIDYGYPIDTVSIDYGEKEKEKEKEEEKEKEKEKEEGKTEPLICEEQEKNELKEFKKLYEENIGVVYPVTAEWLIEISSDVDIRLFKSAIEICAEKMNMNLAYLKGILKKWKDANITTYEQLESYRLQQENKKTKKVVNNHVSKNKFANFEQTFTKYSENELDDIIKKSQKEKFGVGS
ncbi:TPA: DnaD domain protein [Clostridioides difficile]|uniref:DnaD domain protein n=1 Tax=Clostridioides difficile TaxID=1496 RepID=UPI00038DB952|nr:DnaD domain protein [Clostridioides difficile]EQJ74283.1 dnaD domain protein [Clostridioides difficile P38]MCD8737420.1 DnaD domain protein [Clostridioides difficile]MCH7252207.1 DnaD domain protein [Clostridioides difficile]MCH7325099.1 DnaD domain protein [Clostridioides difficile]MCI0987492.1 DnaD domain protein [Clostridioides difficile]